MNTSLEREYTIARRFARIGSLLLMVAAVLMLAIAITYCYAFMVLGITNETPLLYWITSLPGCFFSCFAYLFLALFMHHFAAGTSPYNNSQIRLLVFSGLLFILVWFLEYAPGPSRDIPILTEPISIELSAATQPSFFKLAAGIFIVCIAGIMRYSHALKEDSDSIL